MAGSGSEPHGSAPSPEPTDVCSEGSQSATIPKSMASSNPPPAASPPPLALRTPARRHAPVAGSPSSAPQESNGPAMGGLIQSTLVGGKHTHHSSAPEQSRRILSELILLTGGPFPASEVTLCTEQLLPREELVFIWFFFKKGKEKQHPRSLAHTRKH